MPTSSLCVQTSSKAHLALYPMGTGAEGGWGMTLTADPHLVLRSRMCKTYNSSPFKRLHGV
jgi:hypothetical protein